MRAAWQVLRLRSGRQICENAEESGRAVRDTARSTPVFRKVREGWATRFCWRKCLAMLRQQDLLDALEVVFGVDADGVELRFGDVEGEVVF